MIYVTEVLQSQHKFVGLQVVPTVVCVPKVVRVVTLTVQQVTQVTVVLYQALSVTHKAEIHTAELFVTLKIHQVNQLSVPKHMAEIITATADSVVSILEDVNQTVTVDKFQFLDSHQDRYLQKVVKYTTH